MRAFLSSIAFAALRPQEALALRVRDTQLPDGESGALVIRPRPLSGSDAVTGNVTGAPRVVPACPELVEILRAEVARRGLHPEDAMFTREDGLPLSDAIYRRVWRQAREAVLETHEIDSPLARSVGDLRDARISTWLKDHRTALDVLMVAERVGVSASSLVRRFLYCFQQSREAANDLIEAAFAVSTEGESRHVALKSVARQRSAG
ncbi:MULTISPECIES: hypothetical protein [Streptomyces]|uniref:hypothetical protein n=1 Tax=Streptomyces TaxID=1883 RepID=UPI001678D715|nr:MULTISPECIES: hypothetical protein [Streptomyces]MBK3525364.1 hypothetical protein [Streptomyces sp. MBT70]